MQEDIERTEDRLWDIITEFHFQLNAIDKFKDDESMNSYRIHRLREKLKEIVMTIYIDCAKNREGINEKDA